MSGKGHSVAVKLLQVGGMPLVTVRDDTLELADLVGLLAVVLVDEYFSFKDFVLQRSLIVPEFGVSGMFLGTNPSAGD
jgi:hypothetical protein